MGVESRLCLWTRWWYSYLLPGRDWSPRPPRVPFVPLLEGLECLLTASFVASIGQEQKSTVPTKLLPMPPWDQRVPQHHPRRSSSNSSTLGVGGTVPQYSLSSENVAFCWMEVGRPQIFCSLSWNGYFLFESLTKRTSLVLQEGMRPLLGPYSPIYSFLFIPGSVLSLRSTTQTLNTGSCDYVVPPVLTSSSSLPPSTVQSYLMTIELKALELMQ